MVKFRIVIICGGFGNRLWPLSSKQIPKQFIKLDNNKSLFQLTVERALQINNNRLIIVGNTEHRFLIKSQLIEIDEKISYELIIEPLSKNTGPSILLASLCVLENSTDNLLIFSADHFVRNESRFIKQIKQAISNNLLEDQLYLFGVKPTSPSTEYGYISVKKSKINKLFELVNFKEKPSLEAAKKILKTNDTFWNSGIFYINPQTLINAYQKYNQKDFRHINNSWKSRYFDLGFIRPSEKNFKNVTNVSIDYAVVENSKKFNLKVFVYTLNCGWSDMGSFKQFKEYFRSDSNKNVVLGNAKLINSKNNFIYSKGKQVFALDIDNMIVINNSENILIANINKPESIILMYKKLLTEYPNLLDNYYNELRPWGSFQIIAEGKHFKVKKIVIKPLSKLSYQSHNHRNEHWVVVSGIATVKVNNQSARLKTDESMFIKKKQKHQLINNHKSKNLEIIEVQTGDILVESDIIRYEDYYGRS